MIGIVEFCMVPFTPYMVAQLFMLTIILIGAMIIATRNDKMPQKKSKRRQWIGILMIAFGAAVLFSLWLYQLWYMKKQM